MHDPQKTVLAVALSIVISCFVLFLRLAIIIQFIGGYLGHLAISQTYMCFVELSLSNLEACGEEHSHVIPT